MSVKIKKGVAQTLLATLMAVLPLSACNSEEPQRESASGSISLPLMTTGGETIYRLQNATFTISDGPTLATLTSSDDPNETSLTAELAIGSYNATLEPGWELQAQQPDETFAGVTATLLSPNPVPFFINENSTTNVAYQFATAGGPVTLGTGTLEITIGVSETGTCTAGCDAECVNVTSVTSNCRAGYQAVVGACTLSKGCLATCTCE